MTTLMKKPKQQQFIDAKSSSPSDDEDDHTKLDQERITFLHLIGHKNHQLHHHQAWSTLSMIRIALPFEKYSTSKLFFSICIIIGTSLMTEESYYFKGMIGIIWIVLTSCLVYNDIPTMEVYIAICTTFINNEVSTMQMKRNNHLHCHQRGCIDAIIGAFLILLHAGIAMSFWLVPLVTSFILSIMHERILPLSPITLKSRSNTATFERNMMDYFFLCIIFLITIIWSILIVITSVISHFNSIYFDIVSETVEASSSKNDNDQDERDIRMQSPSNIIVNSHDFNDQRISMSLFSILLIVTAAIWLVPLSISFLLSVTIIFSHYGKIVLLHIFSLMPIITVSVWTIVASGYFIFAMIDKSTCNIITMNEECLQHSDEGNHRHETYNVDQDDEENETKIDFCDVSNHLSRHIILETEASDLFHLHSTTMPSYDDNESICSELSQFSRQSKRVLRSKRLQQISSDGDVWYERKMVHKRTGKKRSFFISEKTGRSVIDEPPSGAAEVIYADDFMNQREEDLLDIGSVAASYVEYNNQSYNKDKNALSFFAPGRGQPRGDDQDSVFSEFSQTSNQFGQRNRFKSKRHTSRLMRRSRR